MTLAFFVVVVFGVLTGLFLILSAICYLLKQYAIMVLFILLAVNSFRPFASFIAQFNGELPANSTFYKLFASQEGLLVVGILLIFSLLATLLQFQLQGGLVGARKRQAKTYMTTRPGSNVITTIVAAEITDEAGVEEVKAISNGSLEVENMEENKHE